MVFVPSLEFGSEDGFMELIEGIVDDAYKLSSLIPRIAKHNGMDHYQIELDDMLDLSEMRHDLMDRVTAVINKVFCVDFILTLLNYCYPSMSINLLASCYENES